VKCPTCAGRYARRVARAILAAAPRRLYAVEFGTTLSREELRHWRVAMRNTIDHQRRHSRWWHGVSFHLWLGTDGRLRGIIGLDAITADEFADAFARWPASLRRIGPEELSAAVYDALRPGGIAHPARRGGYQSVRFTLRARVPSRYRQSVSGAAFTRVIDAMPVVIA
jgi:hypothetical protein